MLEDAQYLCPICQNKLIPQNTSYICAQNHHFDQAKEGYVNLLPVQLKRSKAPGDNKTMVNARRNFLEKGYYQALINKLLSLKDTFIPDNKAILDAGCGEGYYTHQLKSSTNAVYGVDIAKEAVKKAAKKYQQCHFSVATLSHLPFSDSFFGGIISIYAPILEPEFTRILAANGILITVTPAQKHLFELKEKIYQTALDHDIEKLAIKDLSLIHQEQLTYAMTLTTGDDVLNLLAMTPYAFKASEEVKQELKKLHSFLCHADFLIRVYQKSAR